MPVNWHELMNLVAPVVGEVATHGQRGSFLEGFMRAQQRAEQKQQLEADVLQKRKVVGADYLLKIGEHAQGLSDPTDFENFLNLAEHAGTQAGYLQPGDLRNTIKYNGGKQADAQLKELTDQLAQLEKGGYDTDQLAQSGAQLHLKSGKTIPVSTALDLTRQRPLDASGNTVPRPKKADAVGTIDERAARLVAQIRTAKTSDPAKAAALQAEYDDLIKAKTDLNTAGRAPVDPDIAGMNKTLKELQIEAAKTNAAKGKDESLVQVSEVDPVTGEVVTRLVPKKQGEVGRRPGPEPSQGQYQAGEYAGRMEQAEATLGAMDKDIAGMNLASFAVQQRLPAAAQSAKMQSYLQAARNFINAKLRRESGAAISATEFAEARQQYLAQPGDSDEVLTQKRANRQLVFENNKKAAGRAYAPPPTLAAPGAPKEGDAKPIDGYPGTEQTYRGGKWIRTK